MKVSYNWLQSYFNNKLPTPEVIADGLIFHSFEVESVDKIESDTVLDLKILPDRAHDCLCHIGIAREISAIFDIEKPIISTKELPDNGTRGDSVKIIVENQKLCRRYIGRVIKNIDVKPSGEDIKGRLGAIGQRSINNIVDAANYVMFEVGQPLHAFDLDKIKGNVCVRNAKKGEKITTLDDKQIELNEENLVIADDEGPLAIAGVKGGNRAGVTETTKNILLESASFEPASVRRTASKLNLHTDASKRFENDYPEEMAIIAIKLFSGLISQNGGKKDTVYEDIMDIYPSKRVNKEIIFSVSDIKNILGVLIKKEEIVKILSRLGIETERKGEDLVAKIPLWRLDLNIREDIAEEVGRIYGYEKIPNLLPEKISLKEQNKEYLVSNKIREVLLGQNFSEIMGYSFEDNGEVEVLSPLASDKAFLRKNIYENFEKKIDLNLKSSIFAEEPIKIFEIGNIFLKSGELTRLCVGIGYKTKKLNKSKKELEDAVSKTLGELGISEKIAPKYFIEKETYTIAEYEFSELVESSKVSDFDLEKLLNKNVFYRKISEYPRMIRDIALFVSPETDPSSVSEIIRDNSEPLLFEDPILFDTFDKKNEKGETIKRSLAFRMIFQSYERTLSDEEINTILSKIISKLEEAGFEVRK